MQIFKTKGILIQKCATVHTGARLLKDWVWKKRQFNWKPKNMNKSQTFNKTIWQRWRNKWPECCKIKTSRFGIWLQVPVSFFKLYYIRLFH